MWGAGFAFQCPCFPDFVFQDICHNLKTPRNLTALPRTFLSIWTLEVSLSAWTEHQASTEISFHTFPDCEGYFSTLWWLKKVSPYGLWIVVHPQWPEWHQKSLRHSRDFLWCLKSLPRNLAKIQRDFHQSCFFYVLCFGLQLRHFMDRQFHKNIFFDTETLASVT